MAPPTLLPPDGLVTGPDLFRARSRLDVAKGQLLLNVSNQVDDAGRLQPLLEPEELRHRGAPAPAETRNGNRAALLSARDAELRASSATNNVVTDGDQHRCDARRLAHQAVNNPTMLKDKVEEAHRRYKLGVPLITCLP